MSGDYFGSIGALEAARAARRKAVQEWGKETLAEADRALTGGVYAEDWDIFEDFEDEDEDTLTEVELVAAPKDDPSLDWSNDDNVDHTAVSETADIAPTTPTTPAETEEPKSDVIQNEEPVVVEAKAPKATSKRATTSK